MSFIAIRKLSTSNILRAAILSSEYKSGELWKERFRCPILGHDETIRNMNNKILSGSPLSNLELDIFINIARPSTDEKAQLQEAAKLVSEFRKTLMAHKMLPSTPHAICRLFLDSQSVTSLITLLDNRVKYGIFPDFFSTNLLLDTVLESEQFALGSKVASLVMLQEDFGVNEITDKLSLLSLVQYIESKTNFEDWPNCDISQDPVLSQTGTSEESSTDGDDTTKAEEQNQENDDEEDEEDVEYIRVPFLRNPYSDNHFDVKSPRVLCGKSLSALSRSLADYSPELSLRAKLSGSILQGSWVEAADAAKQCRTLKIELGSTKESLQNYIENTHDLESPSDMPRGELMENFDKLSQGGPAFVDVARKECENMSELENNDITQLKTNLNQWMKAREDAKQVEQNRVRRAQLIAEVQAKREELKRKEDYLYFYDKLKQSKLTRIDYN